MTSYNPAADNCGLRFKHFWGAGISASQSRSTLKSPESEAERARQEEQFERNMAIARAARERAEKKATAREHTRTAQPKATAPPPRVAVVPSPTPLPKGWRDLRKDMTREDVRNLLGDPKWTEKWVDSEFWGYGAKRHIMAPGVVVFDGSEVETWKLP